MIKISAKIKIYDESDGVLEKESASSVYSSFNNVSAIKEGIRDKIDIVDSVKKTDNLFLISDANKYGSKLNDNCIYAAKRTSTSNCGYLIGKQYSSSQQTASGYSFANPTYIQIIKGGDNKVPKNIAIVFDERNNEYAQSLRLVQNEETITIDNFSTTLYINDILNDTAKIYFDSWSAPNKPLIITSIYANLNYNIDDDKIISCDYELSSKRDTALPSFGVVSTNASIEFVDSNDVIVEYVLNGKLRDKKELSYTLINTKTKSNIKVSSFLTNDVDYDADSKIVRINATDRLVELQDIKNVRVYLEKNKTMLYVYNKLCGLSPEWCEFSELEEGISNYLESIEVPYFFLKTGSLWEQWQKLCEATGLYLHINSDNKIELTKEFTFVLR